MNDNAVPVSLALALASMPIALAHGQEMEELLVTAVRDTRTIDVSSATNVSPDATRLLYQAPGANVVSNGPITAIPQYRGLSGARLAVTLDGNAVAPSGPNWMDPPLSYAMSAQLQELKVYRGIAPVSVAQESLSGAIDAQSRFIDFHSGKDIDLKGWLSASGQSVNSGHQFDADIQASLRNQRFKLSAMAQDGDDADFAEGLILPSSYERTRIDLGYGIRRGAHELQLNYGYNDTGDAGTPALPMDIDYFDGDLYSATYRFTPNDDWEFEFTAFASDLEHGMTNYHLRPAPPSPMLWRQNIAVTDNRGFRTQVSVRDDQGLWRAGIDGFRETHDSNIDNPNNPMFFVVNFNNAEREVLGAFVEREQTFSARLRGEFGLRLNRVASDADSVNGTPAMMMPPAQALRDAFNAADRSRSENNLDVIAKFTYALTPRHSAYLGMAQKQRGPSYQERYLWLPLEATAGLADGLTYVGNIALDSEKAHTLEMGLDSTLGALQIHPRVFYTHIDDYIQGTPLGMHPATMMTRMMNGANGTARPDPLQFNNVDAKLYGLDMDFHWRVMDSFSLSGLLNYVRAERRDINDNLYRVAPPNMTLRASYGHAAWNAEVELVAYAAQNDVSVTNREQETPGYGVVNIRGSWQIQPGLQIALGADNLFNRGYATHLGGYNRVRNPDIAVGERLPALGANVYARVNYQF